VLNREFVNMRQTDKQNYQFQDRSGTTKLNSRFQHEPLNHRNCVFNGLVVELVSIIYHNDNIFS